MILAHELEDVLDRERHYIQSGSFHEIQRIADLKARLLNTIKVEEVCPEEIHVLQAKSKANCALLKSAARGIRTALRQLQDARSMVEQSTYDHSGARNILQTDTSKIEKKL